LATTLATLAVQESIAANGPIALDQNFQSHVPSFDSAMPPAEAL
jgi:hypothetical protein